VEVLFVLARTARNDTVAVNVVAVVFASTIVFVQSVGNAEDQVSVVMAETNTSAKAARDQLCQISSHSSVEHRMRAWLCIVTSRLD
jgi:hypothetical protein